MTVEVKRCPCGQAIIFAEDAKGTIHPLDVSSPVFAVTVDADGTVTAEKAKRDLPTDWADMAPAYLVSHFRTCSKVDEFRRDYKKLSGGETT